MRSARRCARGIHSRYPAEKNRIAASAQPPPEMQVSSFVQQALFHPGRPAKRCALRGYPAMRCARLSARGQICPEMNRRCRCCIPLILARWPSVLSPRPRPKTICRARKDCLNAHQPLRKNLPFPSSRNARPCLWPHYLRTVRPADFPCSPTPQKSTLKPWKALPCSRAFPLQATSLRPRPDSGSFSSRTPHSPTRFCRGQAE